MIGPNLSLRAISLGCALAMFAMPTFAEEKKPAHADSAHAAVHSTGQVSTGHSSHVDKSGAPSGAAAPSGIVGKLGEHGGDRGGEKGDRSNGFGKQNPLDTANQVFGILQGLVPHR